MAADMERSYHSPQREEQANATRRRILAEAAALFAGQGFSAVTMQAIARQAGVSLATVYLYFPGKAAIVETLAEEIVAAPDLSVEHLERETDPIEQVRLGAAIIRLLNERSWLVTDILRSARGTDDRLAHVWAIWQQRHDQAIRRAVDAIEARGSLRQGLAADEATDILYALAGTEVYRTLVGERGWTSERYERWLFRLGCRELLGGAFEDAPD